MIKLEVVHIETGEREVHYDAAEGIDYTLCGDTLDECAEEPKLTNRRVTCQRCIAIVRHVRGTALRIDEKRALRRALNSTASAAHWSQLAVTAPRPMVIGVVAKSRAVMIGRSA
jgi:hypothetical protein